MCDPVRISNFELKIERIGLARLSLVQIWNRRDWLESVSGRRMSPRAAENSTVFVCIGWFWIGSTRLGSADFPTGQPGSSVNM